MALRGKMVQNRKQGRMVKMRPVTSSSQDWEVHSDFNADNVIADHTQNMNAGAKQPSDTSLPSSSSDSTHIRKRPTAKTLHKRPPHSLKLKDSLWGTRAT
ncbi:hypothetical protein LXL04_004856 [Taraxacum kok-saghyz]